MSIDLLAPTNICGQTLLKLVSRGSAIVAELLRLSEHIPSALRPNSDDPSAAKYAPILFDFKYLQHKEVFDRQLNTRAELSELDSEFYDTHEEVINRFYALFESIYRYHQDFDKYIRDLEEGFYVQHSVDNILLHVTGKQLLAEAVYLWGVMLLLMDIRISGPIRERLIIQYYRHKDESRNVRIIDLAKLCKDTGFRHDEPLTKRPAAYPEEYFARLPMNPRLVDMILLRIRSDDVYNMSRVFPAPQHRSFALAQQASMLYVILYFAPVTLRDDTSCMAEIIARHFSDNWVVPIYMGICVDLSAEWERYRAAREALAAHVLKPETVRTLIARHKGIFVAVDRDLNEYLTEGVLTEAFVVEKITAIMECLRHANTSLRWVLLQRTTDHRKHREAIFHPESGFRSSPELLDRMLRTAMLELKLKNIVAAILAAKSQKWDEYKAKIAEQMQELSDYFSGTEHRSRVRRDEALQKYFGDLAMEINGLDYQDPITAGRIIRKLIDALGDVTKYEQIATSTYIKETLQFARADLTEMVRTVNITATVQSDIDIISDLSYAWLVIRGFTDDMRARLERDPHCVSLLRALFLKLCSVMEIPLVRIIQAGSADYASVAPYYSNQLLSFLRVVMENIPVVVFRLLREIITIQAGMRAITIRFELNTLPDVAQLDQRYEIAHKTNQIAGFTEGILAMEKTNFGVIRVDPRRIFTDGIRKHIVEQLSREMYEKLVFDTRIGRGRDPKSSIDTQFRLLASTLNDFRRCFEYVQDYIGVHGVKMWQEEFTRIIGFNTEQECNKFLKKRVLVDDSKFHNVDIPIPIFFKPPPGDTSGAVTFMGRVVDALTCLTDPRRTIYGPGCLGGGWYDATGREIAGLSLFSTIRSALGVPGLIGLDRLLGFTIERELVRLLKFYTFHLREGGLGEVLRETVLELEPTTAVSPAVPTRHAANIRRLVKMFEPCVEGLLNIGQAQLLRRAIGHELRFSCRMDSNILYGAVTSLNTALIADIRNHYYDATRFPIPDACSDLLPETARYCEAAGINDPLTNIYVTTEPQPFIGVWLAELCIHQIPRYQYDREMGVLVRRKVAETVDGAPFVAGLVTFLKQLHPTITDDWFAYIGQQARSSIHASVGLHAKVQPIPPDTVSLILLMQHVGRVAGVPERILHSYVPAYVFDTLTS